MTNREAIQSDMEFARAIPVGEQCTYCQGTGNELFSMFKACRCCGGTGRSRGNEGEQQKKDDEERTKRCVCCKCGIYTGRWARMNDDGKISPEFPGRYFCESWPTCTEPKG